MAVTVNLGRVQPLYRGPYLASFAYRPLDFVTFEGVTYYCIKPVTGTAPPDPEFWVSILQLPLGLAAGGTGAITAEGARTALGASELGDAVFTAEDAEAARGALGASAVGGGVFVAEDQAAARAAIGATSVGSAVFTAADPAAARAALKILQAIADNPFLSKALREPFFIWDDIPGADVPDNSGTAKFVRLIAGQSEAGGYNDGLLINEQVEVGDSGLIATAEIAVGPLAGGIVALVGTEMSFLRPGSDSGQLQFDQMQRITGNFIRAAFHNGRNASGAFRISRDVSSAFRTGSTHREVDIEFDSQDSPNSRVSSSTSGETRPKNRQITPYMRIV